MNTEHAIESRSARRALGRWLRRTWSNPIIVKEIRTQMRGLRAFAILTGYLLGLGLLAYGLYRIVLARALSWYGPGGAPQSAFVGQGVFIAMAFLELLFVCFVTPALTAGTISGEHERRTYDMLLATQLRPGAILWGKLVPALTYVVLLILAAIPLSSIVFLFGGVAMRDMVQTIGLLAIVAIAYGTLGVFFSALTRHTGRAMALSYAVVVALNAGTVFLWIALNAARGGLAPMAILYANPLSAMTSAIIQPQAAGPILGVIPFADVLYYQTGGPEVSGMRLAQAAPRPLWQYTVALYGAATVLLYLVTTRLVKPVRRWHLGWRSAVTAVVAVLLVSAGLFVVFGSALGSTGWTPGAVPTPAPAVLEPVRVVEVVEMPQPAPTPPAPPTPQPTPTPQPPPDPYEPAEHAETLSAYVAEHVPLGEQVFCDLGIVGSTSEGITARAYGWAHCRNFELVDGALFAGTMHSGPIRLDLLYDFERGWQIEGLAFGELAEAWPAELADRLMESPYDESAGDELVRAAAQRVLVRE